MRRLQVGVVRYASVGNAIAEALGIEPAPDCRIGLGRLRLTFRSLGASGWTDAKRIEHALRIADVARKVLAADYRRAVRNRTSRAIVVMFEDAMILRGCTVMARWECVVPAPS
jgi:hypothetical protein